MLKSLPKCDVLAVLPNRYGQELVLGRIDRATGRNLFSPHVIWGEIDGILGLPVLIMLLFLMQLE